MQFTMARRPRSLCDTCSNLKTATDDCGREIWRLCSETRKAVPEVVRECSSYEFAYADAPWEMEKKAWRLNVKEGRVIGFSPPPQKGEPEVVK